MQSLILFFILPLLSNIAWVVNGPLTVQAPAPEPVVAAKTEPAPAPQVAGVAAPTPPPPVVSESFLQEVEKLVFEETNTERVNNNLAPLKNDGELAAIAREHSEDMYVKKYFEHADPDGCNSACRGERAHYAYRALGENIFLTSGLNLSAVDAAALIVQGWMGSAGHRANILQKLYKNTGIGVFAQDDKIYATAMYSQPR